MIFVPSGDRRRLTNWLGTSVSCTVDLARVKTAVAQFFCTSLTFWSAETDPVTASPIAIPERRKRKVT
jgi:hypothetical protein